jgi:hypothetical protein
MASEGRSRRGRPAAFRPSGGARSFGSLLRDLIDRPLSTSPFWFTGRRDESLPGTNLFAHTALFLPALTTDAWITRSAFGVRLRRQFGRQQLTSHADCGAQGRP